MPEPANQLQKDPVVSKEAIREMAKQWIIDGLSDREMSARRAELAEDAGVSLRSLASVSAYVRYPARLAVRAAGLAGTLDRDQLIWAAAYVDTAADRPERAALLRECGDHLGVEPERLDRAIQIYHAEQDRKPNGLLEREPGGGAADDTRNPTTVVELPVHEPENPGQLRDLVAPTAPEGMRDAHEAADEVADGALPDGSPPLPRLDSEAEEDTAIDGGHQVEIPPCGRDERTEDESRADDDQLLGESPDIDEVSNVRGDLADYDTKEKREWRDWWSGYIRDRFPEPRLREAFVICLPGRKVEPEVSKYLELGIPPERIHAVEGSSRVREEFIANATRLGINYHTGALRKVLPRLREEGLRFDIVNYDFHGQFCRSQAVSVYETPVSHDAILIHNAMAKRENAETSHFIIHAGESAYDVAEEAQRFIEGYLARHPRVRALLTELQTDRYDVPENAELKDVRRSTVPNHVVESLGELTRAYDKALVTLAAETVLQLSPEKRQEMKEAGTHQIIGGLKKNGASFAYRITAPFCLTLTLDLLKKGFRANFLQQVDPIALGFTLWHVALHDTIYCGEGQSYDYLSRQKPGKPPSPFLSAAGRVASAGHLFRDHMEAINFCGLMVRGFWHFLHKAGGDSAHGIGVVNARGRSVGRGEDSTPDDRVVLRRNGERLASLRLKKLIALSSAIRKAERELQLKL